MKALDQNGGWTYFRDSKWKVSKWVIGSSWVTKWDNRDYYVIGIKGQRVGDFYGTTHEAKKYVERMIRL